MVECIRVQMLCVWTTLQNSTHTRSPSHRTTWRLKYTCILNLIFSHYCSDPPWVLTASSLLVLEVITQEADCFMQSSLVSSDWLGRWHKQISKFYPLLNKKVTVDLASLGITYIALAISDQRGILSCCLRPRRHQLKLCKIVYHKTCSFNAFIITSAKEAMFSPLSVCLSVRKISQKVMNGF
jgi:hypothetical protein